MSDVVYINGEWVLANAASVSVFDRGFKYGDGVFETVLARRRRLIWWDEHWERLEHGARTLDIPLGVDSRAMLQAARQLLCANSRKDGILRIQLSRGVGARTYSPKGSNAPVLVMSLHEAPLCPGELHPGWRLITSTQPLPPMSALSGCKTCNRLPQVLARLQADKEGVDEALLLDSHGNPIESSSGNLFWIEGTRVCTPPVSSGILPGITRAMVQRVCGQLGLPCLEGIPSVTRLIESDGLFLTLSSLGVVGGLSLDMHPLARSPLLSTVQRAYENAVKAAADE